MTEAFAVLTFGTTVNPDGTRPDSDAGDSQPAA